MSAFETGFPSNATAFTKAIGVLMRSPHYREYTIGDLEWLLIPAIANGQYRFASAQTEADDSRVLPAAIVLWALVSPQIDQGLTAAANFRPKLDPADWMSGDIPWLVHAAGEERFVYLVVKDLLQTTFKNRKVKILGRNGDNGAKIYVLETGENGIRHFKTLH
ncbi:toxin-activating lysine-acyltransferase [Bradyrhizobium sp. 40]|uniref:toxin-activating lysine-acyltransferase n=1 Tax=Bradyrhizobium sp. 40 TaxID=2782674 RepID=UPI001FFE6185|nr:toxin-activating lysine-acyltransferase [Bradyrhizobium sp. 40]UPJ41804.1 toxin-activating lysine-acyltransferase [Bradyrhizobium sp. 40]